MQRVGSREFKNRMGRYLRAVRKGQILIITDRGKAVAQVAPPDESAEAQNTIEQRLKELESQGLIRLAKGRIGKFKAVPSRGKPASQILIEDRR
jgi:prevent-host-death family protein